MVKDNGSKIILGLIVDERFSLKDRPLLVEATNMTLIHYDVTIVDIKDSAFKWQLCNKQMHTLSIKLDDSLIKEEVICHILINIRDHNINLKELDLGLMKISKFPENFFEGKSRLQKLLLYESE